MRARIKEELKHYFRYCTNDDFIREYWNKYCYDICSDDTIYLNNEDFFNEFFKSPYEVVGYLAHGDYRMTDDYVQFELFEGLKSFNNVWEGVELNSLCDWLVEEHIEEVRSLLEEFFDQLTREAVEKALSIYEDVLKGLHFICEEVSIRYYVDADEVYNLALEEIN